METDGTDTRQRRDGFFLRFCTVTQPLPRRMRTPVARRRRQPAWHSQLCGAFCALQAVCVALLGLSRRGPHSRRLIFGFPARFGMMCAQVLTHASAVQCSARRPPHTAARAHPGLARTRTACWLARRSSSSAHRHPQGSSAHSKPLESARVRDADVSPLAGSAYRMHAEHAAERAHGADERGC